MTPSCPTIAPFASRATTIVAGWTERTEFFWKGMGRGVCQAWERDYGPITLLVFRDYSGWACRCGMFSRRLRAVVLEAAICEAEGLLRIEAAKLMEAM